MDETQQSTGPGWPLLAVLALGAFTTALNVTLLSPLLTSIAAEFGVTDAKAGQLATLTAGSSGAMALLVAPWMDRYSRRGWIRFECVLLALGSVLSAVAPVFGWLIAARVVTGIGGAVIGANCLAAVSDLFADAHQRNRAIGLITTSFTLGSVLGLPILTQISDSFGWRWAIASPAPIAMVVIAGSSWLPRTSIVVSGSRWRGWASGYARILRHRQTVLPLAAMTMLMVVWFGWLIYFGAYAETVFAVGAGTLSLLFLVNGGSEVVSNNVVPFLPAPASRQRLSPSPSPHSRSTFSWSDWFTPRSGRSSSSSRSVARRVPSRSCASVSSCWTRSQTLAAP